MAHQGKLSVAALAGWTVFAGTAAAQLAPCADKGRETAIVSGVEAGLEIRLADGRLLRLVGLEPAGQTPGDPDLAETARRQLAARIAGQEVTVAEVGTSPDRWGRLPAFVFGPDGSVSAAVLTAGLGRYRAEPAAHGCRTLFLAAETSARDGRKGLWADPFYGVLAVDDTAAFAERTASVVVVEARLTAVETGPYRTMLRFAARGRAGRDVLAVSILPRNLKVFQENGVNLPSLIGRTVRVRGLLDLRFGPQVELTSPDALEILPPDGASRGPSAAEPG